MCSSDLSLSPVGNYPLQAVWRACGAFLCLCRVQASTLMLMDGNVSDMVSDGWVLPVEVAGLRLGHDSKLWRAFPVACGQLSLASRLAGLWGFPVALSCACLNDHADGWQVSGMVAAACTGGGFCL